MLGSGIAGKGGGPVRKRPDRERFEGILEIPSKSVVRLISYRSTYHL